MKLLPAIDIYKGKCVRLEKGEFQKSVIYNSCPFDQAKKFVSHGFNSLHIIDLDGAKKGTLINLKILKKIMNILHHFFKIFFIYLFFKYFLCTTY